MHRSGKHWAQVALISMALSATGPAFAIADVETRRSGGPWGSEQQTGSAGPALELIKKMEYLQQEVQELRGKVEEQSYMLQRMQDNQKKLYVDLDSRMRDGPSAKVGAAHSGISFDEPEETFAPSHPMLDLDKPAPNQPRMQTIESTELSAMQSAENIMAEEKAYQQAYRLIQKKDYNGAEVAFNAFKTRFPKGKYLPNVHYWLGEIHLAKNQFELASQAFENVYRDYPQHPKAADALLKMGYVEYAQGHFKRAESIFIQVKKQFSGSTSSQLADAKLSRLYHEGRI